MRNIDELVTKEQLAKKLQVSLRTVTNWQKRQIIPYIKIGKVVRFYVSDVISAISTFSESQQLAAQ